MNRQQLIKKLFGVTLIMALSVPAFAFPQYTSRKNAIKMAGVLDQGHFKSSKIASVFVKNKGKDDYYLQAILDDGSSRKWLIDRVREWTQTDQLILSDNRAIVFPVSDSTEFGILDKNDFYRKVLKATAFVKTFDDHDILEGKHMVVGVRRFRIIQAGEEEYHTADENGDRYRYVLELENGTREFLTYTDVYHLLKHEAFLEAVPKNVSVLRKSFKVRELIALPSEIEDELRDIWRFGVEIIFDNKIPVRADLFPYQVVELNLRDPDTGQHRDQYYIQIVFPNSEKIREVPGFKNLEYLRYVEVATDVEHQKRVILRAQVNPDALELPPYVEITDRNSIIVNFYMATDQSVTQAPALLAAQSAGDMPRAVFTPDQPETEFEVRYLKAVEMIRKAQREVNTHAKVETYLNSLEALQDAALVADHDIQIAQALKQRDILLKVMPELIIRNAQMTILALQQGDAGQKPDTDLQQQLIRQLDHAEKYASTVDQKQKVESLKNIIR